MSISIYRVGWGLIGPDKLFADPASFVRDAHSADFSGVEFPAFPYDAATQETLLEALRDTGLDYLGQIATRPEAFGDPNAHLAMLQTQAQELRRLGVRKAAVQTGADSFTRAQAETFFKDCIRIASDTGLEMCFETHRARPFYNPWTTAAILDAIPELWLTADFSHWMAVIDRWPDDCMDIFDAAAKRARHIHARVGHEKGPQVGHPADPLWAEHLKLHTRWWRIAIEAAEARGERITVSPEFGPPPYMAVQPFTGEPLADLVEVNAFMRDHLIDAFGGSKAGDG